MADKWQNNPFGKGKLYHSGDLARYTSTQLAWHTNTA
jgi:hypothetical protein